MCSLVNFQLALVHVSVPAEIAHVPPLPTVEAHMRFDRHFGDALRAADFAFVVLDRSTFGDVVHPKNDNGF